MGAIEQSPETRGAGKVPSYVPMAEYIVEHIGDPNLTVGFLEKQFHAKYNMVTLCLYKLSSITIQRGHLCFSEGAMMESLQEEVEMLINGVGERNYTRTPIELRAPSHLPSAKRAHRR